MPVRSLNSSVLKWPDATRVEAALRTWAEAIRLQRPDVIRVGYFGSYGRGDWGVGSDLDVIVVVERAATPFSSRGAEWDATELPVPADILVYTRAEWEQLHIDRTPPRLVDEVRWVFVRPS